MAKIAGESQIFDVILLDKNNAPFAPSSFEIAAISPTIKSTDLAIESVVGQDAELVSTLLDLSFILDNDYIWISGFTSAANNGLWQASAPALQTSVAITKVSPGVPVAEVAGDNIEFWIETRYDALTDPLVVNNGVGDYTAYIPTTVIAGSWSFEFIAQKIVSGIAVSEQRETKKVTLGASVSKVS